MFAPQHLSYAQTGVFSKTVLDYLSATPEMQLFFSHPVSLKGIKESMAERWFHAPQRELLVSALQEQYKTVALSLETAANIQELLSPNTFTVTTAHQPNLLTGPLYFVYKILHAIRLANDLKRKFPDQHFVPVYYMGSEDADLDELNHFTVEGKKYVWPTEQKGAVGRMFVDDALLKIIDELERQIGVEPFGNALIQLFRNSYQKESTIQQATFDLVNNLFGSYGLIVLIADEARLKTQVTPVFYDDLFRHQPHAIVTLTGERLSQHHHAQAYPRPINLFYLKDNIRERIEEKEEGFSVVNTAIFFTKEEMEQELNEHPERFSPNVILRGLYQEIILPNIAFIGGGGELAYWLQLKDLFLHYHVPFPVLVLRNSFLLLQQKWQHKLNKLSLTIEDAFASNDQLLEAVVARRSLKEISLNGHYQQASALYQSLEEQVGNVDESLRQHVQAIKIRSLKTLQKLEKKMLRAEKRKFGEEQRIIEQVKSALFPGGGLQERVENFSWYYARYGKTFIDELYHCSLSLEQEFAILTFKD